MKRIIRILPLLMAVIFCFQSAVFATGDPNVDNGGGGLGDGTKENFWNPGNDGVRVTVLDAVTGAVSSGSIDITNINASNIELHFGKVCKASYFGSGGISPSTGTYEYYNPAQSIPTIISDGSMVNIDAIRSYFTDKQVVSSLAGSLGFSFDQLTSGKFKLMIEPIMYITYDGTKTAMTATEAALYNMKTGGDIINKFGPLSHMNLPLAMFLEKDDLGYSAWTGSTSSYATDSDIVNYLGLGIITFTDPPEEEDPPGGDPDPEEEVEIEGKKYEYRTDTDVYTSVTVSGSEHTPDNPVTVTFSIQGTNYVVGNVIYPEDASQLVWVKWHTPSTPQTIYITVTVEGGAASSDTTVIAEIVSLDENPPPNPTAYDRNDSFTKGSVPSNAERTSISWSVWKAKWKEKWVWESDWRWHFTGPSTGYWQDHGSWEDHGEWKFSTDSFEVSMDASIKIKPDDKNPTATGSTIKSGYGINETAACSVSGDGEYTNIQNAVSYFPEFKYKKYWRLLEKTGDGKLEFKKNKYSTYNNRTHFSPIWFPDGEYKVYTWVLDCWTPAGMLSKNCTDSITISGNVYDDWHVAPSY